MSEYATPLDMYKAFLADPEAWDMFIEGPAGSGKTFSLSDIIEWCNETVQDENGNDRPRIEYVICAHTHKACGVLRSTLSKAGVKPSVQTLHSYLRKRPTINVDATRSDQIEGNVRVAESDRVEVMFVDELSMVGEKDLMDVRALQDPEYEGDPATKVVWIGDPFQLPPVKDQQTVIPYGDYYYKLTKNYRSNGPLQKVMNQLIDMLQGGEPAPLKPNKAFHRDADLAQIYDDMLFQGYEASDIAILAYTNRAVQEWNARIAGKPYPILGDKLFCPTLHSEFTLLDVVEPSMVKAVDRYGDEPLALGSKYKTLEFLLEQEMCDFFLVANEDNEEFLFPAIFGTYAYKKVRDDLGIEATNANRAIEKQEGVRNATEWSKRNPLHKLSRRRAYAWRCYLTFKDTIQSFDFTHSMTIHKSQGSTFDHVLLDSQDLDICRVKNFNMYLRLFYVGMSRARHQVWCNS